MSDDFVTVKEACSILGCQPETVMNRFRDGAIELVPRASIPVRCRKPKHRFYLSRAAVEGLASSHPIKRIRACCRHSPEQVLDGTPADQIEWLSAPDAAELLGLELQTFYCKVYRDEIMSVHWKVIPSEQLRPRSKVYFRKDHVLGIKDKCRRERLTRSDGRNPDTHDIAYLAGLFDGEGCVQIARRSRAGQTPCYIVTAHIVNTYPDVLRWAHQVFGGRLYSLDKKNPNHSPIWSLHYYSWGAYVMLGRMLPYLRIKKAQADLAIAFYEHVVQLDYNRYNRAPLEEVEWRETQRALLIKLNGRKSQPPNC